MRYITEFDKKELLKAILTLKTEEESRRFLRDLLTETEMNEFTNRWKVARLLYNKLPYKDIEKSTGMSSTTIARISKWLTGGMGGYQLVLNRLYPKKNINRIAGHHHNNRLKAD